MIVEGFILGLSMGTYCVTACAPVALPLVFSEEADPGRPVGAVFCPFVGRYPGGGQQNPPPRGGIFVYKTNTTGFSAEGGGGPPPTLHGHPPTGRLYRIAHASTPIGQLTPVPPIPQYPFGFLARYCW